MNEAEFLRGQIDALRSSGMLRGLRGGDVSGARIRVDGRELLNFASNDYLAISARHDWQAEFLESVADAGGFIMGSCSSRLLGGNGRAFGELEEFFEDAYAPLCAPGGEKKRCLVFNSGYHANSGILPALFGPEDLVVCDRLVHASIVDGLMLGRFKWARFPHNDLGALEEILSRRAGSFRRVCIVTESVFSMDGDRADLRALAGLKNRYGAFLYVDEAHAVGVFGARGLGLCEEDQVFDEVDIFVGTLGKAVASSGAYAMCSEDVRTLLINRCRPFIFTTAAPPISQLWTRFSFSKIMGENSLRLKLKNLCGAFRGAIGDAALGDTQIVPVVIGEASVATEVSKALFEAGIYAPAVRPPTVPKGMSRIRFSLNAGMDCGDIEAAAAALKFALGKRGAK